ncbi:hypothetical protein CK203_033082 [Vitis vinifera]|uniref:Uncharacterized protein n=1 Tax=Vitis vinifera TaxID=29760 RepID=A0A438HVR0_VITVI|nr:hypothetical protein CK203_033082 [Vitis vinifera]
MHREQERAGDMCEEYDPRRCTPPCNQATKCVGKKGAEAEDEACHQTPKCSRYMDNCHENLRCKRNDIRSLFWQNIPKLSKAPYTSLLGYALLYSFLGGKKRKGQWSVGKSNCHFGMKYKHAERPC